MVFSIKNACVLLYIGTDQLVSGEDSVRILSWMVDHFAGFYHALSNDILALPECTLFSFF